MENSLDRVFVPDMIYVPYMFYGVKRILRSDCSIIAFYGVAIF